jgi:acyl-CoA thioesterase-2
VSDVLDDDLPALARELVEGISMVPVGMDHFTGEAPLWFGDRVFGGVIVAQTLHAALQTVEAPLRPHSLHGYFIRGARAGEPVDVVVDRLHDGRTFSTRHAVMRQGERLVFWMTCSFHHDESGSEYQLAMEAGVPDPDDLPQSPWSPGPFLVRDVGPAPRADDGTMASTRRVWFRCADDLSDDPAVHLALGAYLSDVTGNSFRPLSLDSWDGYTDASLDHALWFHRPLRVDEWLYYDLQAVINTGERSLIRGSMYGPDGRLCMSMAQELLIRPLAGG